MTPNLIRIPTPDTGCTSLIDTIQPVAVSVDWLCDYYAKEVKRLDQQARMTTARFRGELAAKSDYARQQGLYWQRVRVNGAL